MTSLARLLGLENRLLSPNSQIDRVALDCDLSNASERLQKERESSLAYLRTALGSVQENLANKQI